MKFIDMMTLDVSHLAAYVMLPCLLMQQKSFNASSIIAAQSQTTIHKNNLHKI